MSSFPLVIRSLLEIRAGSLGVRVDPADPIPLVGTSYNYL
jgi:hypothetical protein